MIIRSAQSQDLPDIVRLAGELGLDYEDMARDRFWVAEVRGRIVGLVGQKKHMDCDELVALGVDTSFRKRRIGRRLVEALLAEAAEDVYLATLIPKFFKRCGFVPTMSVPSSLRHRDPAWCKGCSRKGCTVMVAKIRP